MKYSEDGRFLAVASSGGPVYVHDVTDHYSLKATTGTTRTNVTMCLSSRSRPRHNFKFKHHSTVNVQTAEVRASELPCVLAYRSEA